MTLVKRLYLMKSQYYRRRHNLWIVKLESEKKSQNIPKSLTEKTNIFFFHFDKHLVIPNVIDHQLLISHITCATQSFAFRVVHKLSNHALFNFKYSKLTYMLSYGAHCLLMKPVIIVRKTAKSWENNILTQITKLQSGPSSVKVFALQLFYCFVPF